MSPLVNITGGFPGGARGEEPAWRCRGHKRHLIRGYGISPGEGNGNPLQYSCPENPMDGEPGGLQSMRSQGQVWLSTQAHTHRTRERKASQSRSVSCDQKQPRRECQSSQEVGTGSLGSSCLPTPGSLQTSICPPQHHVQLTVPWKSVTLSLSRELQGCKPYLSLRSGNTFPIKGISAPVSRGASLLYKVTIAQAAPSAQRHKDCPSAGPGLWLILPAQLNHRS